jgi:hypothetical protein
MKQRIEKQYRKLTKPKVSFLKRLTKIGKSSADQEKEWMGIKENDGGGEFNYDIL